MARSFASVLPSPIRANSRPVNTPHQRPSKVAKTLDFIVEPMAGIDQQSPEFMGIIIAFAQISRGFGICAVLPFIAVYWKFHWNFLAIDSIIFRHEHRATREAEF
jgi:hypothetical protein